MIAVLRGLHPSVRVRLLTTFLNKVFGTAVLPFLGLLFAQRAGVVVAGVLLVAHYLTQFGVGLYGGVLSDTLGRKRLMVWGEGVKVLAFALMLFAALGGQSVWPIFLGTLVLAVGNGLSCPAGEALLIDASTPTDRPVMYALSNWGHNIGYLVGAPLGALLFTDHLADLLALLTGMAMLVWWVSLRFIQDVYLPVCRAERPSFGLKALVGSYRQVASDRAFVWFTLSGVLILSTEFARTTFLAVRLGQGPGGQHLTLPVLGGLAPVMQSSG